MRIKLAAIGLALLYPLAHADNIDNFINAEMQKRHISGMSVAIIDGGKIVKASGYGVTEQGGKVAVTPSTLFQAGSISKSVSAIGALQLVEQGKLNLDEDVNATLVSWKVPENEFTKDKKVTLRGLLSHSAGVTVHGFPGYAVDAPFPTLVQVLNGEKPANNDPIVVAAEPGSKWDYSGGGYTIMQQAVIDVTGKPFADFMQATVLTPLGMRDSTYAQPLPQNLAARAATGYLLNRSEVNGHWHTYAELAAAGLWTTPSDLARFAIGVQQTLAGTGSPVISTGMARQMAAVQKNNDGLGVFLEGAGKSLTFSHGGRNEGFDSMMIATAETGQGAVLMFNSNDNSRMRKRIMDAIAREYHWPSSAPHAASPTHDEIRIAPKTLAGYCGYYDMGNGQTFDLSCQHGRIVAMVGGLPDDEFLPVGDSHFTSTDGALNIRFARDGNGKPNALVMIDGEHVNTMSRIGPVAGTLAHQRDPDPASTQKLIAALQALAQGGDAIKNALFLAANMKKMIGSEADHEFDNVHSLTYLTQQKIDGSGFARFGSGVAKVLFYKINDSPSQKYMIAYLTSDGLLTDADIVDN